MIALVAATSSELAEDAYNGCIDISRRFHLGVVAAVVVDVVALVWTSDDCSHGDIWVWVPRVVPVEPILAGYLPGASSFGRKRRCAMVHSRRVSAESDHVGQALGVLPQDVVHLLLRGTKELRCVHVPATTVHRPTRSGEVACVCRDQEAGGCHVLQIELPHVPQHPTCIFHSFLPSACGERTIFLKLVVQEVKMAISESELLVRLTSGELQLVAVADAAR